jgi:signal transduction histidine kinase
VSVAPQRGVTLATLTAVASSDAIRLRDARRPAAPVLLAAFAARRQLIGDVALVASVWLGSVAFRHGHHLPSAAAFGLAIALPLLTRRRWPLQSFACMAAVAFGQWLADVRIAGDAALLIGLYSVAVREPRRRTVLAALVLELGAVLATLRWAGGGDQSLKLFIGLSGLTTAAAMVGTSIRQRRLLLRALHERAARLERERDQQGRLAAAAERARIAREMHDVVAHNVTVMVALADGAAFALGEEPERAAAALATAAATGRQALTEMRRLLGVLRDESEADSRAPQPGIAQIDELVEQVRAAGLPVTLEVAGRPTQAPEGVQLTAYRVVQEALTNTLKHAGGEAAAHVKLRYAEDRIELEVLDSGAPAAEPGGHGRGLHGMRERAALYGGQIDAGPRADGGWVVQGSLPLSA